MRYLQRLCYMFVDICAMTMRQQTLERGEAQLSGKYLFMNLNQVLAWLFMILSKIAKHENPFGRHCISNRINLELFIVVIVVTYPKMDIVV